MYGISRVKTISIASSPERKRVNYRQPAPFWNLKFAPILWDYVWNLKFPPILWNSVKRTLLFMIFKLLTLMRFSPVRSIVNSVTNHL
jgi:hypothetical protein